MYVPELPPKAGKEVRIGESVIRFWPGTFWVPNAAVKTV